MSKDWFTSDAALAYTLGTGRMFCDFAKFHEWTERLAGRPILTHEFGDRRVWAELRAAFEEKAAEVARQHIRAAEREAAR